MPKSKITPPPWFVKHNPKRLAVRNKDGDYVAESIRGGGGEAEANANLIAAAPDLLAALEDIATACEATAILPSAAILPTILAALARANGTT